MNTRIQVLIVEDIPEFAEIVAFGLKRAGYEVVFERVDTAADMNVALDHSAWDLILLDYQLPHFDGLAALDLVRQRGLDVPCIFLTGDSSVELVVEAMRRGAADFVSKDRPGRLLPAIDRALHTVRDRREPVAAEFERRLAEANLRQGQKLGSIRRLATGVAHEINTPSQFIGHNMHFMRAVVGDLLKLLTRLKGLLRVARANAIYPELITELESTVRSIDFVYLSAEIPKAIDESLDGIERIGKIVAALREFSYPGVDQKVALDLNRAIDSTLTVCRSEWRYVADLVTRFAPDLPSVVCVPAELNHAILNIVVNAARAVAESSESNGQVKGTITVTTRRDYDWVEIRIHDTGVGIPESVRDNTSAPPFTARGVSKSTDRCLAIARSVLNEHGGTISFETETGQGTTCIVRLPFRPPPASEKRGAA